MISRGDVVEAYQKLLRRVPENEDVIRHHMAAHDRVDALEQSLRASPEYNALNSPETARKSTPFSSVIASLLNGKSKTIRAADLDWFISESDKLGPPATPPVDEFWKGMTYSPTTKVNQDLDPFSEEYVAQQIALYREISGREIDQGKNELTDFDLEVHVAAANPYAHHAPHGVAVHIGRVARAIEYSGLGIGAHVLDMGCGWGTSTELMAFSGLRATGLDINPKFVELVNRRAARLGHKVDAVVGSFESIPGDTLYDAVLYYECLHHAIKPWETLSLVHSRLKPGGKLLLAGEPINDIWKHWGLRTDPLSVYCIRKFGWFESGWSARFLATCVERCGFKVTHFENEPGSIGWIMVAEKTSQ